VIASPVAPHVVAGAVVPFEPWRAEISKLVAAWTDVPGFGNQNPVMQNRIVGDTLQQPRIFREAVRVTSKNRCKIEAEPVNAGLGHEVAHGGEHQFLNLGPVASEGIAAAGVVDQGSRILPVVAIICGVAQSAQ
jgi:hypothetical protein